MIINKTKNIVISKNFSTKNAFAKIRGLIGKKSPEAIVFKTRFGIHTFLLKFPIDVIILDKNNRVVMLKKKLLPNRFFFWNVKYNMVIELPSGSLEKSKTEVNDILELNL